MDLQRNGTEVYWKDCRSAWWDGYLPHHKVVALDDFRRDTFGFSHLLRIFDRYPLSVQVKGTQAEFLAKWIIVTTTKKPSVLFAAEQEEDLAQLTRRINVVIEFPLNPLTELQLKQVLKDIQTDCMDPLDTLFIGPTEENAANLNDPLPEPNADQETLDFIRRQGFAIPTASMTSESMNEFLQDGSIDMDLFSDEIVGV
jgi:hypothetical protein